MGSGWRVYGGQCVGVKLRPALDVVGVLLGQDVDADEAPDVRCRFQGLVFKVYGVVCIVSGFRFRLR